MFCPRCGKENTGTRKFCIFCGTNLETVSQALSGDKLGFFTRIDGALDNLLAKYSEHVFDDAPSQASDRRVANSWKILGKGIITSFVDLFLSIVMWNVFVLRWYILLVSTPFRLLSERSKRRKLKQAAVAEEQLPQKLPEPTAPKWLPGSVASITEYTTERLQEYRQTAQDRSSETDGR
jgi:hypothetical protein